MDATIAASAIKALLGGAPSVRERVAAFVRVVHQSADGKWSPDVQVRRCTGALSKSA